MQRFASRRPSSATILALVALFVALGGTSYAAATKLLPKNSVGSVQVINGSLQKGDLSSRAIASLRGLRGAQGPVGPQGSQGSPGPKGDAGPKGDTGPSDAYEAKQSGGFVPIGSNANTTLASVNVPAGAYVVEGSAWLMTSTINGNPDQAICTAFSADNQGVNGRSQFVVPAAGQFTNSNHHEFFGTLMVSTAGPVSLHCSAFPVTADPADNVQAAFGDVVLIRVGSLTTN